jgi:hypothetical protein
MRTRWKPDNRADAAVEIAAHACLISKHLDVVEEPAKAREIYVSWCGWAEQRRVCQQIIDHIDEKYWFRFPKEKRV